MKRTVNEMNVSVDSRVYRHVTTIAIVPACNEADTITTTVRALQDQTMPLDRIIVVPNNCTDNTAELAKSAGAEVWIIPEGNPHRKAGAMNWAINQLLPDLQPYDQLLMTDADSTLHPSFLAEATRHIRRPIVGAVCANFLGNNTPGILAQLQRNEYSRFTRQIKRNGSRARVLSGVATLLRVDVIRHVINARTNGQLPYSPGLYHYGCATEDIELTFAVRRLGFRPVAPFRCVAVTDTLGTTAGLWHQRVRWQRGMLDSLRLYRLGRDTVGEVVRQVLIYAGSLTVPAYLGFLAVTALLLHGVPFQASWLPLTGVFVAERVLTVRRDGWRAMLLAAPLAVEWAYEQFRSFAYWSALVHTIRGSARQWKST